MAKNKLAAYIAKKKKTMTGKGKISKKMPKMTKGMTDKDMDKQ